VDAQGVRAPHAGKLHRLDFSECWVAASARSSRCFWASDFFYRLRNMETGLIAGLLSIVSYGCAMLAFRYGARHVWRPCARPRFYLEWRSRGVLKERLTRWRVLGIASIAVGTILLV